MSSIEKLKELIKGKTCCVLTPGKSLTILEERIEEFKDLDVVWIGMNYCDHIEEAILKKIDKQFDMISDCTTVAIPQNYEPERIQRYEKFLGRGTNLLFISDLVKVECFQKFGRIDILEKYADKIATIDDVFTGPDYPQEIWNKPPNSITLLFAALIAGMAKKVIMFGFDGRLESNYNSIDSYYKADIIKEHRVKAYGQYLNIGSLTSDSKDFNVKFIHLLQMYKAIYSNPNIEIINCSPDSIYTAFKKINYDQVKGEV